MSLFRVVTHADDGENVEPVICVHPKRGRGKPTLYTAALSRTILQDIEQGVPKTKAFVANGISLQTGYDWEKAHPEFAEAVKCAREKFRASWRRARSRTSQSRPPSSITGTPAGGEYTQARPSQIKATLTIVLPPKRISVVTR